MEAFRLVVLDWMLPGHDGLHILEQMRASGLRTPVLLLTARDAIEDRVLGLDSGADDYLVKPFAFAELLARIRLLLRRGSEAEPLRKQIADLVLDLESRRVTRGKEEVVLRPREFDLLAYLLRHQGQTVTRKMLAHDVWREPRRATPLDNVIDVHVTHLRRKIDEGRETKLIHTIRGVGFVLREEAGS
jgi:two-component system copper resistance phosphate regulon response regulator CusR